MTADRKPDPVWASLLLIVIGGALSIWAPSGHYLGLFLMGLGSGMLAKGRL